MGSNKYMITKNKCWPVFKKEPKLHNITFFNRTTFAGWSCRYYYYFFVFMMYILFFCYINCIIINRTTFAGWSCRSKCCCHRHCCRLWPPPSDGCCHQPCSAPRLCCRKLCTLIEKKSFRNLFQRINSTSY